MFGRQKKEKVYRNPYDREEAKLIRYIDGIDCDSPEYERAQKLLKENSCVRESSRESKKRMTKEGRGNLWLKILGIGGTLGSIVTVALFERNGMTYTGEKRNVMDSLVRTASMFFNKG